MTYTPTVGDVVRLKNTDQTGTVQAPVDHRESLEGLINVPVLVDLFDSRSGAELGAHVVQVRATDLELVPVDA